MVPPVMVERRINTDMWVSFVILKEGVVAGVEHKIKASAFWGLPLLKKVGT